MIVRKSADDWFDSMVMFHSNMFSSSNNVPTVEDLKNAEYCYKGFMWDVHSKNYSIGDESLLYYRTYYVNNYNEQNKSIINYFKYKKDKLLVVDVAEVDAMKRIYDFLGHPYIGQTMPHLNATK